jgi:hypothetical protein
MKRCLLLIAIVMISIASFSQRSDYLVIKKRNNRTLKTYFPGTFIAAVTYGGFNINGFVKTIRNDSIYIEQQERQLMPTDFGSTLDTLIYTIGIDYREIKKYNFTSQYVWGRKRGFVEIALPKIMIIGGVGYLILELVNTAYRGESINDHNKLYTLGVAAGIAATGFLWEYLKVQSNKAGGKYKVVYVHMVK